MSINHLSALRIAGEVGLGIGTITGGSCAASYGGQIIAQNAQIKEHDKKVQEVKDGWKDWVQYGVSCLNSINNKAFVNDHEKNDATKTNEAREKASREALDCKDVIKTKLEKRIPGIQWGDKSPGSTKASNYPTPA